MFSPEEKCSLGSKSFRAKRLSFTGLRRWPAKYATSCGNAGTCTSELDSYLTLDINSDYVKKEGVFDDSTKTSSTKLKEISDFEYPIKVGFSIAAVFCE